MVAINRCLLVDFKGLPQHKLAGDLASQTYQRLILRITMKYQPLEKDSQAVLVTERHMALQITFVQLDIVLPYLVHICACLCLCFWYSRLLSVRMLTPRLKLLEKLKTSV